MDDIPPPKESPQGHEVEHVPNRGLPGHVQGAMFRAGAPDPAGQRAVVPSRADHRDAVARRQSGRRQLPDVDGHAVVDRL